MNKPTFIAGPCVIESQELLNTVAEELVRLNKKYDIDIILKQALIRLIVQAYTLSVVQD